MGDLIIVLNKRIEELTESRDHWKREWSLLNAGLNMAEARIKELEDENKRLVALNDTFPPEIARLEDRVSAEYEAEREDDRARIKELEAEVGRLMLMNPCNHTGFESAPCDICGYPDPRKLIARLKDERDADRRREYGYSQQTVDALTLERDKLRAEKNDWKARYQSVSEMHDALIKEYNEVRAENKRLRAALDGIITVSKIICNEFPVGTASLWGERGCETGVGAGAWRSSNKAGITNNPAQPQLNRIGGVERRHANCCL